MSVLIQLTGVACILTVLADVFLTVLVARYGTSVLSEHLFALTWRCFRAIGKRLAHDRCRRTLIYAGPAGVVLMCAAWVTLLDVGFALVYWPLLGTQVRATSGQATPTDFITALYISTDCLSTAGNGDFAPTTSLARLITLVNSVLGITTITLAVTYLVQIFNALRERNSLALSLDHSTNETGDAAQWLVGLSAGGTFPDATMELGRVVERLASVFETYHFYASLLYFNFAEARYSQARVALIVMDASALIRTAVDADAHPALARHGNVEQLGRAGLHIAQDLADIYLPAGLVERMHADDAVRVPRWRARYAAAREALARAGVTLTPDAPASVERYIALRGEWDAYVRAFATELAQSEDEVFTAEGGPADD